MSSITNPIPDPLSSPATDPYYYGFRDECFVEPDGSIREERIALTLEDHLHPHEGDQFMEGSLHDLLRGYLRDVFRMQLGNDPTALVLSDTGVYWEQPPLRHHCPDVAVIFGVREQRAEWRSFMVGEQGVRPTLIVELVTPRYRVTDVERKFRQYHQAQVPTYVILDREHDGDPWVLRPYQRGRRRYVAVPVDERGRFWLPGVDLWLGVAGQQVLCYEDESDEPLGDYTATTNRLARAQAIAEAAELRAEMEKDRAESEKARAEDAEARVRALEAELARIRGQTPSS